MQENQTFSYNRPLQLTSCHGLKNNFIKYIKYLFPNNFNSYICVFIYLNTFIRNEQVYQHIRSRVDSDTQPCTCCRKRGTFERKSDGWSAKFLKEPSFQDTSSAHPSSISRFCGEEREALCYAGILKESAYWRYMNSWKGALNIRYVAFMKANVHLRNVFSVEYPKNWPQRQRHFLKTGALKTLCKP